MKLSIILRMGLAALGADVGMNTSVITHFATAAEKAPRNEPIVKPFTNSLGMPLMPLPGTKVLFCIWETRVQDYQAFAADTGRKLQNPGFAQGPTHPAVNVSWEDAQAFCKWLTGKEQQAGVISEQQSYRLPTDAEWSQAVGLENETGSTPEEKNLKIKGVYPWGTEWPPPKGTGNFADETLKKKSSTSTIIPGYDDGYAFTAPVGSFKANKYGLYDLAGNVWEWCEDWYDGEQKYRVLRGGAWGNGDQFSLLSSHRVSGTPGQRFSGGVAGWRVAVSLGE